MLQSFASSGTELWISRRILREYLATLMADVVRVQAQFRIAEDGPAVTANLPALLATIPVGGKQVHDANIVATMQAHGLRRLLTHNTADFARFGALIGVEPMAATP